MNFNDLHHGDLPLLLPNAWDYITGAALADAGFAAIGTTSLGVAAAAGKPDAAGDTREETLALARILTRLPIPVTVDVEGGFAEEPGEVADLVAELSTHGIAGVNIEDGRADGSLTPVDRQTDVLAAVKEAAPEVFVNARTDTFWLAGNEPSMAETLRRAHAYTGAGADGIFVPGVARDDHIETLVTEVARPLNILYQPGRTDYSRLAELGVARISCGSLLFRTALHAAVTTAAGILGAGADQAVPSYAEVQALLTTPARPSSLDQGPRPSRARW